MLTETQNNNNYYRSPQPIWQPDYTGLGCLDDINGQDLLPLLDEFKHLTVESLRKLFTDEEDDGYGCGREMQKENQKPPNAPTAKPKAPRRGRNTANGNNNDQDNVPGLADFERVNNRFKNNEKRKEKSRDAARSRRSKETEIFNDMMSCLPVAAQQGVLDKASIMRLAISFIKVKSMAKLIPALPEPETKKELGVTETVCLKALEGFMMVLSQEGDVVFLTENVCDYLGITQVELMGQNIFEFSHPCDHEEIRDILSAKDQDKTQGYSRFFIRMKCTLTSKGRAVNIKSATYKVISCNGHMVSHSDDENDKERSRFFVAVGQPIPHPANIEAPLPRQTFMTKHSLDMKFTHADDEIMTDILGYTSEDLIGKSVYEFQHAMDTDSIGSAFKCLFSKGQCETSHYRFLAKNGGYVWVMTQATLIYDKMCKPQSVVCVNHVVSGVECKDEVYSAAQSVNVAPYNNDNNASSNACGSNKTVPEIVVEEAEVQPPLIVDSSPIIQVPPELYVPLLATPEEEEASEESLPEAEQPSRPLTATAKIFAPRTEEMNKGFLTFSEKEPGLTMLKDEPDDLTHLAPVAGDVCVPLDDHPFLNDMLDDFLLKENFGPLLTDEPSDPFISYRDSYNPSPQLLSPNMSKSSDCSLPSLNSPGDSLGDEDQMSAFISLNVDDDCDTSMKSPYMQLSMENELPLLMSNDLMWGSTERNNLRNTSDNGSSLAQLLCSSINKQSMNTGDGGGMSPTRHISDDLHSDKGSPKWESRKTAHQITDRLESRANVSGKRTSNSTYDSCTPSKRCRRESQEKMSPELLHQLMSNNQNRQSPKGKSNWLFDSGGQKAACISQPSDSVLMNLLATHGDRMEMDEPKGDRYPYITVQLVVDKHDLERIRSAQQSQASIRRNAIRKKSISLLEPEAVTIPSLLDLTQQDFDVNAPVNSGLLQGTELLMALDVGEAM